jgi:transposase-like protein
LAGIAREFGARILDLDACRRVVLDALHPEGGRCPFCGLGIGEGPKAERFRNGGRVVCAGCGKRYSYVTGTVFARAHLDPRAAVLLIFLTAEGFRVARIAEILDLDRSTVRTWKEKITEMMA